MIRISVYIIFLFIFIGCQAPSTQTVEKQNSLEVDKLNLEQTPPIAITPDSIFVNKPIQKEETPTKKKLNGLQLDPYEGDRNSLRSVSFYRNDTLTWQGFPAAGRDYIIPIKQFHINEDSTYVKAPYINGNTWYEGSFRLVPDTLYRGRKIPCEYGIHKVYHLNGKLKALIDFTEETIMEYDSTGFLKYEAHFKQYKIHQQAMLRSNTN